MKKKLVTVLIVIIVVLTLLIAGALGIVWYRENHIFVEDAAYPINATQLDLREEDISFEHYHAVRSQLPGCEVLWNVPFQNGKYSNDSQNLSVASLTEEDVAVLLEYFPELKKLDASACQDYDVLESLKAQKPELEVIYTVSLGGKSFTPDTKELVLENGDYEFDTMMENLPHLMQVSAITLRMPELSLEQVDALKAAFENITFTCTAEILGQEYDTETTELDLSALTSENVAEVAEKLSLLPELSYVNLMDGEGNSQLTKEDVKALMAGAPDVVFDYAFEFYGERLSTADEEVYLKNIQIGDEGEAELRLALDLLTSCNRMVLDNCHFSNDVLAKIRDDYRHQTKVVWRIWFGRGSTLTDAEIIRAVYDLSDSNCKDLIYCEDARFVDFGHNGDDGNYLHDCSYVAGMPNLEAIILSSAYVTDLSAFENCKKLKMLELVYCGMLTDISPLANCESLEMLNISFTGVTDLSPLDELPITHLCAMNYSNKRVSQEEQQRFQELHPDCWSQYVGEQPYGPGWRYTEDGKDYLDYYQLLRDVFQYDIYPKTPNHVGWYLSDELIEKYSF